MTIPFRTRMLPLAALSLALGLAACGDSRPATAEAAGPARVAASQIADEDRTEIVVYKTPTCGCCTAWEEYLEENGFRVTSVVQNDLSMAKQMNGVPASMQSCHTGVVEGYTIEGHVPADVIRKLLAERPAVQGIAVPGMPIGSPGMEHPSGYTEPYEVFTFDASGPREVFAVK
jgi:hypothetical protein